MFFKLENLNVIRKKVFEEEINVVILLQMQFPLEQIKINMSVLYIFFYFYILNIYYISGTSTEEIWHCLCKKTHTQKKNSSMLKYKENTFVTPMSSSYFLLAQFAKTKRKEKKEIVYTEPAEGALSFYTSKSLLKTWTCMSPLHTSWNVSTFSAYFFTFLKNIDRITNRSLIITEPLWHSNTKSAFLL